MPIISTLAGASARGLGGMRTFDTVKAAGAAPAVGGYQAWYDSSDQSTITLNGTNVSQWNDKSANALHLTQSTSTYQPDYTSTQNGWKVLSFNSDLLYNSSISNGTSHTVFVVVNPTGGGNDQLPFCFGSDSQQGSYISYLNNSSGWRVSWEGGSGNGRAFVTGVSQNSWQVWVGRKNGSTSKTYVNASNNESGGVSWSNNSTFTVGNYWGTATGSYPYVGKVAEIVNYNSSFSDGNITTMVDHLKSKWGIA